MEPLLAEREQKEEEVRELLELAEQLEGLTRNVGMHAGGVLIAPGKLTDFCPLYARRGHRQRRSRQFDKDDVEAVGLVKFDFLGLTTLTILDWTRALHRAQLGRAGLLAGDTCRSTTRRPTRCSPARNTTAVFQFESRGMRDLLKQAPARPLRGHHRAGRAVPAGADGADPGVHRAQARQAARRLPRSAPGADPRARPTASWCTRSR